MTLHIEDPTTESREHDRLPMQCKAALQRLDASISCYIQSVKKPTNFLDNIHNGIEVSRLTHKHRTNESKGIYKKPLKNNISIINHKLSYIRKIGNMCCE